LVPAERYEFFKVIQGYLDQAAKLVDLQPHVAERDADRDLVRLGRQHDGRLELTVGLAHEHHLTAALIAIAHEARHVRGAFQAVNAI
jgi:hypothetical protein